MCGTFYTVPYQCLKNKKCTFIRLTSYSDRVIVYNFNDINHNCVSLDLINEYIITVDKITIIHRYKLESIDYVLWLVGYNIDSPF